jgi:hypothetical protein
VALICDAMLFSTVYGGVMLHGTIQGVHGRALLNIALADLWEKGMLRHVHHVY